MDCEVFGSCPGTPSMLTTVAAYLRLLSVAAISLPADATSTLK